MSPIRSILPGLAAAALLAVGCVQPTNDTHPIARAIPTADQVAIHLPQSATTRTVGQLAPYYVVTRNVTRDLNGGTAWVLILVHSIVQYPPTSTSGDTSTWGPWDGGALDPASYQLTVTSLADGTFDWSLQGKSKTDPNAHFITVISGNAVPSVPAGQGSGRFSIDFDNAQQVNPVDNNGKQGVVDIAYDLAARTLDMQISTTEDRDLHVERARGQVVRDVDDALLAGVVDRVDQLGVVEVDREAAAALALGHARHRVAGDDRDEVGVRVGLALAVERPVELPSARRSR